MKTKINFECLEPRQMMTGLFMGDRSDYFCSDVQIQLLYLRNYGKDRFLDRSEMISLFQNAKDGGTVSTAEVQDLRNIVSRSNMPADVKNLAGKVLRDSPSSPARMDSLLDKWFYGKDRPSLSGYSNVSYAPVNGSLFVQGARSSDIKQGSIGDCYLLASLGALADKNNTVVNTMFNDNRDGSWSVRFYKIDGTRYIEDYVTVDRFLPVDSSGRSIFASFQVSQGVNELWVSLAEKAYAQWARGNSWANMRGGWSDVVFREVTGSNSSNNFDMSKVDTVLVDAVKRGNPVVIYRYMNTARTSGHAYHVESYTNGSFRLVNPWGWGHLVMTAEQIKRECYGFAVATRRVVDTTPPTSRTLALAFASLASNTSTRKA